MPIYAGGTKLYRIGVGGPNAVAPNVYAGATRVFPEAVTAPAVAPTSFAGFVGATTTFTMTPAQPDSVASYQWYVLRNAAYVPLGTAITQAYTAVAGDTQMLARVFTKWGPTTDNPLGYIDTVAPITVYAAVGVTVAPTAAAGVEGTVVNFTATPSGGSGAYTYQWYISAPNEVIAGATAATYAKTLVLAESGRGIFCQVASAGSAVNSNVALMTVTPAYLWRYDAAVDGQATYQPMLNSENALSCVFYTSPQIGPAMGFRRLTPGNRNESGATAVSPALPFATHKYWSQGARGLYSVRYTGYRYAEVPFSNSLYASSAKQYGASWQPAFNWGGPIGAFDTGVLQLSADNVNWAGLNQYTSSSYPQPMWDNNLILINPPTGLTNEQCGSILAPQPDTYAWDIARITYVSQPLIVAGTQSVNAPLNVQSVGGDTFIGDSFEAVAGRTYCLQVAGATNSAGILYQLGTSAGDDDVFSADTGTLPRWTHYWVCPADGIYHWSVGRPSMAAGETMEIFLAGAVVTHPEAEWVGLEGINWPSLEASLLGLPQPAGPPIPPPTEI